MCNYRNLVYSNLSLVILEKKLICVNFSSLNCLSPGLFLAVQPMSGFDLHLIFCGNRTCHPFVVYILELIMILPLKFLNFDYPRSVHNCSNALIYRGTFYILNLKVIDTQFFSLLINTKEIKFICSLYLMKFKIEWFNLIQFRLYYFYN